MASMAHVELTGVGIAPTGYARGAHAVVVEIVATKGVLGVQPLWTHAADFPVDLTRRLHNLTRRRVERTELLELDDEIGGHYAELVEDLLVGALSACHLLWYLHLCADNGLVVTAYEDRAEGMMVTEPGAGRFTDVVLRPCVTIEAGGDTTLAIALHDRAHEECFIANSVNFPVRCEPSVNELCP